MTEETEETEETQVSVVEPEVEFLAHIIWPDGTREIKVNGAGTKDARVKTMRAVRRFIRTQLHSSINNAVVNEAEDGLSNTIVFDSLPPTPEETPEQEPVPEIS